MSDKEKQVDEWHKHNKPTYIMIPRKFVIAWISTTIVCLISAGVAVQWSAYLDTKSNQRWCGIIQLFNEGNKETPPDNERGRKFAQAFIELGEDYKCK